MTNSAATALNAAGDRDPSKKAAGQQRLALPSWRPAHEVRLSLLQLEGDRGGQVDEQLHPEDLDRQERLAEAVDRRDQDEPQQRHVGRDQEDQALLDVVHDPASLGEAIHERGEGVVAQDEVGGLSGNGCPGTHRHGHVGAVEGGGVVDAVAGDRDRPTRGPGEAHQALLLLGRRAGDHLEIRQDRRELGVVEGRKLLSEDHAFPIQPGLGGDGSRRDRMIAGDHDDLDARPARGLERFADPVAQRIGEADQRANLPLPAVRPARQANEPLPAGRQALDPLMPDGRSSSSGTRPTTTSGAPMTSSIDALRPTTAGSRDRAAVVNRLGLDQVGRVEARVATGGLDRPADGRGE